MTRAGRGMKTGFQIDVTKKRGGLWVACVSLKLAGLPAVPIRISFQHRTQAEASVKARRLMNETINDYGPLRDLTPDVVGCEWENMPEGMEDKTQAEKLKMLELP